jgi:mono/diheme cytochrome c family protein
MPDQPPAYFAEYNSGEAHTASLVALYARDGIDITNGGAVHVLTADEFAAIAAYAMTIPSTPGNNVWD